MSSKREKDQENRLKAALYKVWVKLEKLQKRVSRIEEEIYDLVAELGELIELADLLPEHLAGMKMKGRGRIEETDVG